MESVSAGLKIRLTVAALGRLDVDIAEHGAVMRRRVMTLLIFSSQYPQPWLSAPIVTFFLRM
jgi:hypothetical protein